VPDRGNATHEAETKVTDDRQLLDELCQLGEALAPFNAGILTNTLSVTEQLDFGYRLIRVAGLIRGRVENQYPSTGVNGSAP
jgi:hypothetical protein